MIARRFIEAASRLIWASVLLASVSCTRAFSPPLSTPTPPISNLLSPPPNPTPTYTPFQPLIKTQAPSTDVPPSPLPLAQTPISTLHSPPSPHSPISTLHSPLPTLQPLSLWIDPSLPAGLLSSLALPAGALPASQPEGASLRVVVGEGHPISRWVYALAAPFPTLEIGVSLEQLQRFWREGGGVPLLVDESTHAVFTARWGGSAQGAVTVVPAGELLDRAWNNRPSWAILPFEGLEPRWKVLEVDGLSPVRKGFDPAAYPLTLPVSLDGDPKLVEAVASVHGPESAAPLVAATNRDSGRLTILAMTGVTALVRATAFTMEQQGVRYPARDVGDWLREADITHVSNEVPFARDCPSPNPVQEGMRFCSDPRYIALLEEVGTDVVELTGDHFQDWGEEAMLFTLDLYRERGWPYYGGGANLDEGRRAVTLEHNGNRLAFIGCNGKGGGFAQAGPRRPGAVKCDEGWMHAEIARLRAEGYLPIATFQHFEYYTYKAQPDQVRDFRGMAGAGAVIVSGSQAHQPQGIEFENGALIHYGLGNLFFDQYDVSLACRQAFIDRHVFYNGRHISTELLPILFVDYARPRPMAPEEREDLLQSVFRASGW